MGKFSIGTKTTQNNSTKLTPEIVEKIVYVDKIIQAEPIIQTVEKIVYQDKIVEVPVEVIKQVEKIVEIDKIVFKEDTTKIQKLEKDLQIAALEAMTGIGEYQELAEQKQALEHELDKLDAKIKELNSKIDKEIEDYSKQTKHKYIAIVLCIALGIIAILK